MLDLFDEIVTIARCMMRTCTNDEPSTQLKRTAMAIEQQKSERFSTASGPRKIDEARSTNRHSSEFGL